MSKKGGISDLAGTIENAADNGPAARYRIEGSGLKPRPPWSDAASA
jgi:hypothetical protein